MISTLRSFLRQYRVTLLFMGTLAVIGLRPELLAPLGRLYVIMCSWLSADAPVGHHYPPLLVAFIAPVVVALLIAGVVAGIWEIVAQRQLSATLDSRRLDFAHLDFQRARELAGSREVVVTSDPGVYAFCSGLIRPRIYLSRGVLNILDDDEIDALLCHERHHQRQRDPSRLFLASLLRGLAPILPALEIFDQWARVRVELAADRAALASQPPEVLASAMLKVMRGLPTRDNSAIVAGLSPTEARIAALLGKPASVEVDRGDLFLSGLMLIECAVVAVWLAHQTLPNPPLCPMCPAF